MPDKRVVVYVDDLSLPTNIFGPRTFSRFFREFVEAAVDIVLSLLFPQKNKGSNSSNSK